MKRGISLIEVILVISVLLTLIGMASVSFLPFRGKTALDTTTTTLISDLRSQQTKAMVGDTEGRASADSYGIRFETNSYILFHGTSFNSLDSSNFEVNLENITLESTFPSSEVIFSIKNGEVLSFIQGQDSITVRDIVTQVSKTININRYGVVVQIN